MSDLTHAIEICICTFQRPGLIETLRSLDGSKADIPVSILVIDNDETTSAKSVVDDFAAISDLPVSYVHCPGANISIARNGALAHARARFLAFLDDDETANPDWVAQLRDVMLDTSAAVVLGPVQALYDADAPGWMQRADVHATLPVFVDGKIKTGYSCNALIDRAHAAFDGLDFDVALGRTGGEDTAFFTSVFERGGQIAFASDAVVQEKVPAMRARFTWLAKRRYRMGQTHGRLLLRQRTSGSYVKGAGLAFAKTIFCAGAALTSVFHPVRRNKALLRGCLHAGTLSAHLGLRNLELYGNNESVTP